MWMRAFWAILLLATFSMVAHADIPGPDGRRARRPQYIPPEIPPAPAPKLVISRDNGATTAKLILPKNVLAAVKSNDAPRMASTRPTTVLGLALVGSLIAGGLWLVRVPRAKYVATIVVLASVMIGTSLHAQPARLEAPRDVLERGKLQISRDASATNIQLILPKKAASN